MDKKRALTAIEKEIASCLICQREKSGLPVPGEGSESARIMFIGEAPGRTEATTGRPFVGRSGKLLRSLIAGIGLSENDIFITSPVKYLPNRGTPTKKDIIHGMIHTRKQIEVINPKLIVLLGSTAVQGILGEKISITKSHGGVIERDGRTYMIMFHPAAGLRFPSFKEKLSGDFLKLQKIVTSL